MARLTEGMSADVIADLAELSLRLSRNAETRKPFLNAVKKIDPARRFPTQEIDDLREEMASREEQRKLDDAHRETTRALEAQRSTLLGSFSEDQVKEIEGVMTKYGLSDYEAGRDLWQARRPEAPPADGPTATWTIPTIGDNAIADVIGDPTKYARDEAYKTITEFRRGRRVA